MQFCVFCLWAKRSAVDSLVLLSDLLKGIVWALLSWWITSGTGLGMIFHGRLTMPLTLGFGVILLYDHHLTFYAFCEAINTEFSMPNL